MQPSIDLETEEKMTTMEKLYQETGYAPIDDEHAQISEGLDRLLAAVNTGAAMDAVLLLGRLTGQVAAHFAHEERLMAEAAYPLAARHKETHDLFLRDAGKHLAELKAGGLSPPFRRWATGRVLEWFRFHIAANDVGLGRFLMAREQARRAETAAVAPVG